MKKLFQEVQYSILIYAILLLIIIWASYGIFSDEKEPEAVKISIIVEDSNHARWTTFRLGLETAARDKKVDLNYISTTEFQNLEDEWGLVKNVKDSSDGIILAPKMREGMDEYYEPLSWEISLGFVESDVKKGEQVDDNIIVIVPDYLSIADHLFTQLKDDFGQKLKGKKVVFYSVREEQLAISDLWKALVRKLETEGCEDFSLINYRSVEDKKAFRSADILIGLDDMSLLYLAKEKDLGEAKKEKVYGIGVSESTVYYLDKGIIDGMVVIDDFNMGYESVSRIAETIRNKYSEQKGVIINDYPIRPDEVHDPEIENLLFPVVQ
ncbi:MAG: hypothetical protein MJ097_02395 [Dorea sp.]|nr:hypothetical protein [Dorea sp.]